MTKEEIQAEALSSARTNQSLANYPAIFAGFMAKGIPESEIRPRENVFTFNAWKALGRSVKKGEHGVKVLTWITCAGKVDVDQETGHVAEEFKTSNAYRRPHSTTVFHVSQTEPTAERDARMGERGGSYRSTYRRGRAAQYVARDYVRDPGEDAADRWSESHGLDR